MINRRDLLVGGVSAGITAGAMHVFYTRSLTAETPASTAPPNSLIIESGYGQPLDNALRAVEGSDKFAAAWLEQQSTKPTIASLANALKNKLDLNNAALDEQLFKLIQQDFSSNKTVAIEGWSLSETESQLAALRYLVIADNPDNVAILRAQEKAKLQAGLKEGEIAPLKNWGPRKTTQGQKFNEQSDGHSGLWFQFSGAPSHAKIMIDGELVRTVVNESVVTSGLFGEMQERILATPGEYDIALVDPIKNIKQPIGSLTVKADPRMAKRQGKRDSVFCSVSDWGPRKTTIGKPNNEQPDGAEGIWVKTSCLPSNAQIMLEDDLLPTTAREFGATTSIPMALLESPGERTLYFFDQVSQEKVKIGTLLIEI
ncbi:hypothetical protein [uncultured Gilvimarinus sp.]|uniref:hypothetical protein n=1 Tax=uncultured Gilvimarinus sp. TaxID=1689143 RepID=UPI0030EE7B35|tara:strand:- start:910 stop:2022 length:1113 start_codon:yes stop_codon:yes gene_type:complete